MNEHKKDLLKEKYFLIWFFVDNVPIDIHSVVHFHANLTDTILVTWPFLCGFIRRSTFTFLHHICPILCYTIYNIKFYNSLHWDIHIHILIEFFLPQNERKIHRN